MATLNPVIQSSPPTACDPFPYQARSLSKTQKRTDQIVSDLILTLQKQVKKYRQKPENEQIAKGWFSFVSQKEKLSEKDKLIIVNRINQITLQILLLLPHISPAVFKQVEIVLQDWGNGKLVKKVSENTISRVIIRLQIHLANYNPVNKLEITELYKQLLLLAPCAKDNEFTEIEKLTVHTNQTYKNKIARIKELRTSQKTLRPEEILTSKILDFLEGLQATQKQAKTEATLPWQIYALGTAASNQLLEKQILKQLFFRLVKLANEAIPCEPWGDILMCLDKEELLRDSSASLLSQKLSLEWTRDNLLESHQFILKHQSKIFGLPENKTFTLEAINPTFNQLLSLMGEGFLGFNAQEKEFIIEVLLEAEKQADLNQHISKQLNSVEEAEAIRIEIRALIEQAKKKLVIVAASNHPENLITALESAFNILNDMNLPVVTTNPTWRELMQRAEFTLTEIGKGSFGTVYLAKRDHEQYVVKEFFQDTAQQISPPTLREWLSAERGERTARIKHPYLIMTIGAFISQTYVQATVMPYIENSVSLVDMINKKKLSPQKIPLHVKQLLQAVKVLHDAGLIHKDIKVENILVMRNKKDEPEKFCLIDAGLQEKLTKIKPKSTFHCGSPDYAAPEVWKEPHDQSADIFSLGITLLVIFRGGVDKNNPRITLAEIPNANLKKLISDMLNQNPAKRPDIDLVIENFDIAFPHSKIPA